MTGSLFTRIGTPTPGSPIRLAQHTQGADPDRDSTLGRPLPELLKLYTGHSYGESNQFQNSNHIGGRNPGEKFKEFYPEGNVTARTTALGYSPSFHGHMTPEEVNTLNNYFIDKFKAAGITPKAQFAAKVPGGPDAPDTTRLTYKFDINDQARLDSVIRDTDKLYDPRQLPPFTRNLSPQ